MKRYKEYISEKYVNLIGDDEGKEKYVDEVWDLLQKSYAPIGGIGGSGFKNKQDMIDNVPFWKLGVKNGKVVAVNLYKDKGGRKSVAFGSDGSPASVPVVKDIIASDLSRSFGEKSKAMLGKLLKTVPWDVLEPFLMTPEQAAKANPKKVVTAITDLKPDDIPEDGKITLKKYPQLRKYAYTRQLGGRPGNEEAFKVMLGTPGRKISRK